MAAFRKSTPAPAPKRKTLVASAMRFDFSGAQSWDIIPPGDRRWQVEAWRHYDQCGEMRYAVGWKGNACSQATLYAADVDPNTGRPTGPTDNTTAQKIADGVLGGPVRRPQHVRTMAVNLDVAGEVYVLVLAGDSSIPDEWLVISSTEMNMSGRTVEFTHPGTGKVRQLGQKDLMIRIWQPHPRLQLNADSSIRALLPDLREIEKTSQNIAARLDSRLASAGLLLVPDSMDVVHGDDDPDAPQGIMEGMARSMSASMQEPGSASAQVPIILMGDREDIAAITHIDFETKVSAEIIALRDSAIARFSTGMDLPREILEGMGKSNHWSSWQVEESTYKTHLLPLLDLISDALTTSYYLPALVTARVPNPQQFMLAFDGSSLIGEPDPLAEGLELYDRGLITSEALLAITSTPEEYAPKGDEKLRALAERLVIAAPTLIDDPELRRLLGFSEPSAAPVAAVPSAQQSAVGPAEDTPATGQPDRPLTASAGFEAASLAVTFALERAGNRLLNTQRMKSDYANMARHELHLVLKPDVERYGELLADAWRHCPMLAQAYDLDAYTRALMAAGAPHSDENLRLWLARRGY
jgi:hypothetical protein